MGNHIAGRAMGMTAAGLAILRGPGEDALSLLDAACRPYHGCDAEFEAEDPQNPGKMHPDYTFETDPLGPLGKLIAEAFAPGRDWAGDWAAWEASEDFGEEGKGNVRDEWYEGPYSDFRRRYEFC